MHRLVPAALAVLVLASTAACGSDDPPTPPSSTPSTSPSTDLTTSPTTSPTTGPTTGSTSPAPTDSSATPTTGFEIAGSLVSVRLPAEWKDEPSSTGTGGNGFGPTSQYNISLGDNKSASAELDLDFIARTDRKNGFYDPPLDRLPDTTIAGQPAYHLAGRDELYGAHVDRFGFIAQDHFATLDITTPPKLSDTERQAFVDSVLASVTIGS